MKLFSKYIANCFVLGEDTPYTGQAIYESTKTDYSGSKSYEFLENGVILEGMGDGRYYDEDENQWAEVYDKAMITDEGELRLGSRIGFVQV